MPKLRRNVRVKAYPVARPRAATAKATEVGAEFQPGIGWMYTLTKGGVLQGRYGNFETEGLALAAGRAARAKAPGGAA